MAQLERSSKTSEYSRSPKAQASPALGQHLQETASSEWVSKNSSPIYDRNYDHNKKSVFMKVKEKAKQLRHSLSGKKKHGMGIHDDDNSGPAHSNHVKFQDAEEDPKGAPMHELEVAPESIKHNSGHHHRTDPVIPANLALPTKMNTEVNPEKEKPTSEGKAMTENVNPEKEKPTSPGKTMTENVNPKKEKPTSPGKAMTENVSDTDTIDSKIAGLTIKNSNEKDTNVAASADAGSENVEGPKNLERTHEIREHSVNSPKKYDKGVSVKEYMKNKLEPGEDDKALSHAISDSSTPNKSPRQKGVVDKFRDADTSFIWSEQQSEPTTEAPAYNPENPSPNVPVPTSISEEIVEKPHERVLQSN